MYLTIFNPELAINLEIPHIFIIGSILINLLNLSNVGSDLSSENRKKYCLYIIILIVLCIISFIAVTPLGLSAYPVYEANKDVRYFTQFEYDLSCFIVSTFPIYTSFISINISLWFISITKKDKINSYNKIKKIYISNFLISIILLIYFLFISINQGLLLFN